MEDVPDISWGCDIDSVENATSLQRWLTNSGLPPHKMAIDRVDIKEREKLLIVIVFCYRNVLSYKAERWLLPRSWHRLNCTIDEVPTTTTVTNLQKFMLLKFDHLQALAITFFELSDSVENATSLQRWLTNSGLPPHKMAIDRVDIKEREVGVSE
ncbi:hypothetical protein DY000_02009898 [Brassica cretica]|uniref:Uncharacterized protein n=1 Tax=Brassica cretica TaxID=69181 RepID=A0ABQ7C8M6_BRACR|nr:hypothetical protein DY000_02009898 [Brassica cretica]